MGPPSYMRCVVDRNVVMRRIPVLVCSASIHGTQVPYNRCHNRDVRSAARTSQTSQQLPARTDCITRYSIQTYHIACN
jgi:hypothetical protein